MCAAVVQPNPRPPTAPPPPPLPRGKRVPPSNPIPWCVKWILNDLPLSLVPPALLEAHAGTLGVLIQASSRKAVM